MRYVWVVAWALAVAGPALYLMGEFGWWVAAVAVLPLSVLATWRAERFGGPVEIQGPWRAP